jgi:acylphosphatase
VRPEAAAHLLIHGRVQGVGYRFYAQEMAGNLNLTGWVRNRPDGDVEALVEGSRQDIETFIKWLEKGPTMAHVESVNVDWPLPKGRYAEFSITG